MSSLTALKTQEYEVMQGLVECIWDEDTGENLSLTQLQTQIQAKAEAFISVTKKDGLFDQEIATVKNAIEKAKDFIERLDKKREFIKSVVYGLAITSSEGFLTFHNGISKEYVKPFMGERTDPINTDEVEPQLLSYTLARLSNDELETLREAVDTVSSNRAKDVTGLTQKLSDAKKSCNKSDLPEGHKAIHTKLTPSFKIVKTRPKL